MIKIKVIIWTSNRPCIITAFHYRQKETCDSNLTYFWNKIKEISQNETKFKSLEDTVHMKYIHEEKIPDDVQRRQNFFRERLKDLGKLLMNIIDLKRKHLHYIKHLHPFNFKDYNLKFGPFSTYENNLDRVPTEYITIPYIIQSMLLEIEKNFVVKQYEDIEKKNQNSPEKDRIDPFFQQDEKCENKNINDRKPCPFSLKYFQQVRKNKLSVRPKPFRKFYEGDILNMYLFADKRAKFVTLSDTKTLMNQNFFHLMELYNNSKDTEIFLPHIHHQGNPNTQKFTLSNTQTNHFLNLLYLSCMKTVEKNSEPDHSTKHFICSPFDSFNNINYLPKSITKPHVQHNWYQKFDSMLFRWREPVSASILAQWLFRTQQEFSEVSSKYCEATNTLVIYFHQNLEHTGTRTKIWKESLRTVTCFRDFCNFYYFEDANWFSKYEPMKYISYETYKNNEEKFVFERIIENNEQYKNYEKLLIPYYYCDNFYLYDHSCSLNSENVKKIIPTPYQTKPNFEDIVSEIKNYPSSKNLLKHCRKSFSASSLTAHDDKPPRFGLTGTTHDFFSHDGVQVSIDTSRFYFENFKLSISVKFDGYLLVGHYLKRHIDSHLVLKDGTIIKLILPFPRRIEEVDSCTCSEDIDTVKSIFGYNSTKFNYYPDSNSEKEINIMKMPALIPEEKHVIPVYGEDMAKFNIDLSLIWNRVKQVPHDKNVRRDIKLLNQMFHKDICHKYMDSKKLRYIKRKYKYLEIPISFCIRRILKEPMKRMLKPIYRRKISIKNHNQQPNSCHKTTPHVKLSLPNGLILESSTLIGNENEIAIKQTHMHRETYKNIMTEDYRLYLDHGILLIRYSNGDLRILNSQGIIVELKQKNKIQHDRNKCFDSIKKCRKMYYKLSLINNKICHNISDYGRSRRGHISCSKKLKFSSTHQTDFTTITDLYSSLKLYTLDGEVLKIEKETVMKKHFTKVLRNWDFQTGQTLLERTDGMKVWNMDNGDQAFIFPDGTKITKSVEIAKTPEFFKKTDGLGWVNIYHTYLYEHPLYCPVKFENLNKMTTVMLKHNVLLRLSTLYTSILLDVENELLINSEQLLLTKTCSTCKSKCICDITVNLKDGDDENTKLLVCQDSYEKIFSSDFLGRCQINNNFIKDELNNQNCNHVQRRNYHRALLINSDLTGEVLWNDTMIVNELEKLTNEDSGNVKVEQFTDASSNSVGIIFKRSYYENLNERFLWAKYLNPISFSHLETNSEIDEIEKYQVSRRIFNVLREQETKSLYHMVRNLLENDRPHGVD